MSALAEVIKPELMLMANTAAKIFTVLVMLFPR